MEEEKKLYPLEFCVDSDEYAWGTEEFLIADLGYKDSFVKAGWLAGNSLSEVIETYVDRLVGENVYDFYGRQFPVCFRRFKVKGKMPLRVSPEDELGADRYNFLGKERLWYIESAGARAKLFIGFAKSCSAEEVYNKCLDNTVDEVLNSIEPKAGEYYFIPSGTVFSASGDLEIFEISESSPLDFTLCRYGAEFEGDEFDQSLSLEEALDFIDYKEFSPLNLGNDTIISLPQFIVKRLCLSSALHSRTKEGAESFVLYTCIRGAAALQVEVYGQSKDYKLGPGESLLVPAECLEFNLVPLDAGTELLETSVIAVEVDNYLKG